MIIGIIYSIISIISFYLLNKYKCCEFNPNVKESFCIMSIIALLWPLFPIFGLVFLLITLGKKLLSEKE